MQKKKYLFSNDLMKEAAILGISKLVVGMLCLGLLIFYIHMYTTMDEVVTSARIIKISGKSSDEQYKNPVANFIIWGSDRKVLMLILPYLDCVAFTGLILIWASYRRMIEIFQLWIISAIIFCMADMILIIPTVSYAQDKIIILGSYIFSCVRKIYAIWIVKEILVGLRAEADAQENGDFETSSFKRY